MARVAGNSVRVLKRHYVSEMVVPADRERLATLNPESLGLRNLSAEYRRLSVSARQ